MNGKPLHHPLTHLLLIVGLGILAYSNSFGAPFVLDDLESIVRNETLRSLGNFLPGGTGLDFHFRRWVAYFSFALNYRSGGLNVTGYHVANLVIHLGTAALLYALVRLAFRTPLLTGSRLAPKAGIVALLAALFFVAHPVQTQAVTYVVQRLTSLCTFFYLLSLVLYVWGRLRREETGRGLALPLAGALLAAVLAMFTKEIALTLPLAACLFEFCFFQGELRNRLPALLLLLTLAIVPALVISGQELSAEGTLLQTRDDIPRLHYLFTQFPVIATYLRLLLLPVNQNLDYDYPIYTTFFTPPVFLSFLLLAGLLTLAFWLFRKSTPHLPAANAQPPAPELRLIAFGLFWFFLTLSVESSFVPLADVIFEHRLYLPSVGIALALAVGIGLAMQKTATLLGGRLPLLAAAVTILALAAGTWQRNQVWRSEVSLWTDVTRKSPKKSRPWYNLGTHLTDSGKPAEAIAPLMRAVTIDPRSAEAWHNLGRAYLLTDRVAEAIPPLRAAVRFDPEMDNAAVNLAAALINNGLSAEAIPLLERVCQRIPDWAEAHFNLGLAYAGVGNFRAAQRELTLLSRLSPPQARSLAKLIDQTARASRPK
ncbi:MAG: tetratricopeptide repeat protein [Desulfuromonas sp.]|nr:tetratricopeptide repeat protein [Desulfuromonas sp.]